MTDGIGCTCAACSAYDCCCDGVDWTPRETVVLREENRLLRKAIYDLPKKIADFCFGVDNKDSTDRVSLGAAYLSVTQCLSAKDGLNLTLPDFTTLKFDSVAAHAIALEKLSKAENKSCAYPYCINFDGNKEGHYCCNGCGCDHADSGI